MPRIARTLMTAKRAELLRALDSVSNGLTSEVLKVGTKQMASQMQRSGLVQWRNVSGNRHSLAGQVLHITPAGRAALKQWDDEWKSVPATD